MKKDAVEAAVRQLIVALFPDAKSRAACPHYESIVKEAPARVAESYIQDLLSGYDQDPAAMLAPLPLEGPAGPVALRGVNFTSVCEHHLLPYSGVAHLGFVPRQRHTGLGALARLVDLLSRRLTLQESLTAALADTLVEQLDPVSVIVSLECEHGCLATRGPRKAGHRLITVERRREGSPDLEWMVLGRSRL